MDTVSTINTARIQNIMDMKIEKTQSIDIVDFHSHILPRADHGSDSTEMSIKQLNMAMDAGVTRIIVTPHFYPNSHTLNEFLLRREKAYSKLLDAMKPGFPEIRLGAEVLLCDNLHKFSGLDKLCINGTNILLLELPYHHIGEPEITTVTKIIALGFDVILAHADKYSRGDIEKFVYLGAKIQLNAGALASLFAQKHLFDWIERGLVVALGSDIHGVDKSAYKKFKKAIVKIEHNASYIAKKSDEIWNASKK